CETVEWKRHEVEQAQDADRAAGQAHHRREPRESRVHGPEQALEEQRYHDIAQRCGERARGRDLRRSERQRSAEDGEQGEDAGAPRREPRRPARDRRRHEGRPAGAAGDETPFTISQRAKGTSNAAIRIHIAYVNGPGRRPAFWSGRPTIHAAEAT